MLLTCSQWISRGSLGPAEIDGVGHVERPAVAGQELRVQSADEHGAIGGGLDPRHAAEPLLHPRHVVDDDFHRGISHLSLVLGHLNGRVACRH
jgi:hypothetical protein